MSCLSLTTRGTSCNSLLGSSLIRRVISSYSFVFSRRSVRHSSTSTPHRVCAAVRFSRATLRSFVRRATSSSVVSMNGRIVPFQSGVYRFGIMLRGLWRFLSRTCYAFGLEKLSLKFLVLSLDDANVEAVSIDMSNQPKERELGIVFEDMEAMAELDSELVNTVRYPDTPFDIN